MGSGDSKVVISYETCVHRCSSHEIQRFQHIHKRVSDHQYGISQNVFLNELLQGVPRTLAVRIFDAVDMDQNRYIDERELIIAFTLLAKGDQQEKLRFLFNMYCEPDEVDLDLVSLYNMIDLVASPSRERKNEIHYRFDFFDQYSRYINFETFSSIAADVPETWVWILELHPDRIVITNDEDETANELFEFSIYAKLTRSSGFPVSTIRQLERLLRSLSLIPSADLVTAPLLALSQMFAKSNSGCKDVSVDAIESLMYGMDQNQDGHLDIIEFVNGLSVLSHGSLDDRLHLIYFSERFAVFFPELKDDILEEDDFRDIVKREYPSLIERFKFICSWIGVKCQLDPMSGGFEANYIAYCLKNDILHPRDACYMISVRWWRLWQAYSSNDVEDAKVHDPVDAINSPPVSLSRHRSELRPGAIDNTDIVTNDLQVLNGLYPLRDYVVVTESAWNALHTWYGGGPVLQRTVLFSIDGDEYDVNNIALELHLCDFECYVGPAEDIKNLKGPFLFQMSAMASLEDLKGKVCQVVGSPVDLDKTRLWTLENPDRLLDEYDQDKCIEEVVRFLDGGPAKLELEVQLRDGSWPYRSRFQPHPPDEDVSAVWSSGTGLCGLDNLGNTCFLNASMQCLSHTQVLTDYFLSAAYLFELQQIGVHPSKKRARFAIEYASLLYDLWNRRAFSRYSPDKFRMLIGKLNKMFSGQNQHDAEELLNFVLNGLQDSLNRRSLVDTPIETRLSILSSDNDNMKQDNEDIDDDSSNVEESADEVWQNFVEENSSMIIDSFYFQIHSSVSCNGCDWTSSTYQPYSSLQLPVPKRRVTILISVTMFRLQAKYPVINYAIALSPEETIQDLLINLSEASEVELHDILLADYNLEKKCIYSILSESDFSIPADRIRNHYNIVAFEQCISMENECTITFLHRMTQPAAHALLYQSEKELFGFPIVLRLPHHITEKELHEILQQYFTPMFPGYDDDIHQYRLRSVTRDGKNCTQCPWLNACPGCEIQSHDGLVILSDILTVAVDWDMDFLAEHHIPIPVFSDSSIRLLSQEELQVTLNQCLQDFVKPESVELRCPECKEEQAFKDLTLQSCPPILIIQLKRFGWDGSKVSTFVDYPIRNFDIADAISPEAFPLPTSTKYNLYAVVNHLGAVGSSGHYISYINTHHDSKWYCFDDHSVREINEERVVTPNAYILFYQRNDLHGGNLSFTTLWGSADRLYGKDLQATLQIAFNQWMDSQERRVTEDFVNRKHAENEEMLEASEECVIL